MLFLLRCVFGRVSYIEWVRECAKRSTLWKRELDWMEGRTNQ